MWPALPYDAWKVTYATLHTWTQVLGRVALAQVPPLNHSWTITSFVASTYEQAANLAHWDRKAVER